jgi:hypothetical protein
MVQQGLKGFGCDFKLMGEKDASGWKHTMGEPIFTKKGDV